MSGRCGAVEPTVLNGKIVNGSAALGYLEYECLSGFYMTGNKRIVCITASGLWEEKPVCNIIDNSDTIDVFPEWWFYALAAILGVLVLCCILCLICYFCCGHRGNAIYPYHDYSDDGCCACCRRSRNREVNTYHENGYYAMRTPSTGRDGVYFIPVKSSQVYLGNRGHSEGPGGATANTRTSGTQTGREGGIQTYTKKPSKDKEKDKEGNVGHYDSKADWVSGNGVTRSEGTQTANGGVVHSGLGSGPQSRGSWNRESRDSKAWKDSFNETQTDYENGDLYGTHNHPHTVTPAKPAKEVKAWMPHSKPVRTDHNTSTK